MPGGPRRPWDTTACGELGWRDRHPLTGHEVSAMPPVPPDGYTVRRFRLEDAPAVTACVRAVYGDAYLAHLELYDPTAVARLNASGELVSVVALDPAGVVVGHYALERPGLTLVAESGEAMVAPAHQHHGLLERMRVLLEGEAARLGLLAIFGRCVTTHVFSQRAVERFGERPCGVSLGRSPAAFHAVTQASGQRVSTVMYVKYLRPPAAARVHAPARYRDVLARIYRELGRAVEFASPAPPSDDPGAVDVDRRPDLRRAVVRVIRVGAGTAAEVARLRRVLCGDEQAEAVYVELPLAQPGAAAVAEAAAGDGFCFSGVGPHFLPDGDALRLQYLAADLDLSAVQLLSPFARELLAFIDRDWRRPARA
jgi:hypothetical protein